FKQPVSHQEESVENEKKIVKTVNEELVTPIPLESSKVDVDLNLEHRQKGLLWYSTYKVGFSGVYSFRNRSDKEQLVDFRLQFPTAQDIYDNLTLTVDGVPVQLTSD